ncbi:MAG TPA: hypothetical protein VM778_12160, partial [Gemmatimonadota bacterium]|nr:hypothetical protein [Gemmatimonadota bacterium]
MGSRATRPVRRLILPLLAGPALAAGLACAEAVEEPSSEAVEEPASEAAASAHAADAPAAPPTLELRLVPSRDTVRLGEPVHLYVRLRNRTDRAVRFHGPPDPEYGFLELWIRAPAAEEVRYRPPVRRERRGAGLVEVAPGDSLSVAVPIYYGGGGWTLERPGEYAFRALYAGPDLQVASDTARLAVRAPADDRERGAARAVMTAG